jgi:hypothetical protein
MKFKISSRLIVLLMAAVVFLILAPAALAQNCALCYTQASAAGARMIQALRSGILILIVPPTLGTIGMLFIVHRKRNQVRLDDDDGRSGQGW